jgi:UDP-N-acetylglucosamine 1-carboxyvinyltransferase
MAVACTNQPMAIHGGRPLRGEVAIGGYKHALTVVAAAAVAAGRRVTLRNVPMTTEVRVLAEILGQMGARSELSGGDHLWELDTRPMRSVPVPAELSRRIHGSLYLAPAMLARFGSVSFAGAGGDRIGPVELGGARPTAQVAAVMERFGAVVDVDASGGIHAAARSLRGCTLDLLEFSSHASRLRGPAACSATKTALLLGAMAGGETGLRNPVDREATRELGDFLRVCGASVTRAPDGWRVRGGATSGPPLAHDLISDSTEIVTFAVCAAITGGSLLLTGITGERSWPAIAEELRVLRQAGVPVEHGRDWLRVDAGGSLRPCDVEIECNGLSTDAHPLLALLLLGAGGESRITDHVWTNRFAYAELLEAMGGRVEVRRPTIHLWQSVLGPPAAPLRPTDSRAAAVAVLAGLAAPGSTTIEDAGHLDRGYERLAERLRSVGAQLEPTGSAAVR